MSRSGQRRTSPPKPGRPTSPASCCRRRAPARPGTGAASDRRWRLRASSVVPWSVGGGRRSGRLTVGGQLLVLRQVVLRHLRRAELVRAAIHVRHFLPIAVWGRRRQRPFKAVVLPWVQRRLLSLP